MEGRLRHARRNVNRGKADELLSGTPTAPDADHLNIYIDSMVSIG